MTASDALGQAKARPALVAEAVRATLRDAVAWRVGGGGKPSDEALIARALAVARCSLDALASDGVEREQTLAEVGAAARRFARSPLCRRLMSVPAAQFVTLPGMPEGPDAIVRDHRRRLHAIVISAACNPFDAGAIATRAAQSTRLPVGSRLKPLNLHVFALATARRYSFEREVFDRHTRGLRVGQTPSGATRPGEARVA